MTSPAKHAIHVAALTSDKMSGGQILSMLEALDDTEGRNRDFAIRSILQDLAVLYVTNRHKSTRNNRNILEDVCRRVKERLGDKFEENEELIVHLDTAIGILALHFAGRHVHRTGQELSVVRAELTRQVLEAISG